MKSSEQINICFIANFYKTIVFEAIAQKLSINKVKVYWIVTKDSQLNHLSQNYPQDNILSLTRSYIKKNNYPLNDFKINELVFGDRVWKYEKEKGIKYLTNIQLPIYDFIKNNSISYIFGETTWAHEILINRMCRIKKELFCEYYSDYFARIPNGRFLFFKDEKHIEIFEREQTVESNQIVFSVEKPSYLAINDRIMAKKMSIKGLLNRFKRLLTNENLEKSDPNVLHGFCRISVATQEILNQITYKYLKKNKFQEIKDKKYIFFGFHKQPEATIDVCGRYSENQFENVVNLWRQLPPDWYLVIKEHSNAVGDRSFRFFRNLAKFHRIILMHEKEDSHKLIRHAQLVATNTGTMALEAALMNIPAITFSPVLFNKLNYCRQCSWTDLERFHSIVDLLTEIKAQSNNIDEYAEYIVKNSFDGILTDLLSNPSVISVENIKKLSDAILEVIHS
jgi:hypothetical protein